MRRWRECQTIMERSHPTTALHPDYVSPPLHVCVNSLIDPISPDGSATSEVHIQALGIFSFGVGRWQVCGRHGLQEMISGLSFREILVVFISR